MHVPVGGAIHTVRARCWRYPCVVLPALVPAPLLGRAPRCGTAHTPCAGARTAHALHACGQGRHSPCAACPGPAPLLCCAPRAGATPVPHAQRLAPPICHVSGAGTALALRTRGRGCPNTAHPGLTLTMCCAPGAGTAPVPHACSWGHHCPYAMHPGLAQPLHHTPGGRTTQTLCTRRHGRPCAARPGPTLPMRPGGWHRPCAVRLGARAAPFTWRAHRYGPAGAMSPAGTALGTTAIKNI